MKPVGVVRFLGTNCDQDVFDAVAAVGFKPKWVWYQDQFDRRDLAAVILPGGFSYGDYLRSGALAARAPVMKSILEAANHGTPVLGICNGFQILCEARLLPGVLLKNDSLRFRDGWVKLQRVGETSAFGNVKESVHLPIAHGDGRYYVEEDQVKQLFDDGRVWWRYEQNPNGSLEGIAGVLNDKKNVAGLMPHPERAMFSYMGGTDGRDFFTSFVV